MYVTGHGGSKKWKQSIRVVASNEALGRWLEAKRVTVMPLKDRSFELPTADVEETIAMGPKYPPSSAVIGPGAVAAAAMGGGLEQRVSNKVR